MTAHMETVLIEISQYTANKIQKLAKQGGFGEGLKNSKLDAVARVILNKQMMAAERKIRRIALAKQKEEQVRTVRKVLENLEAARKIRNANK